ncbi:MAG: flagellar biosynthetic protein FliR [Planctomycetia bacterium]|nr:flagellar biosynthetic protein FliR [Planctomycetia bacterium]
MEEWFANISTPFFLVAARFSGFFAIAPLFSGVAIPLRYRAGLALVCAWIFGVYFLPGFESSSASPFWATLASELVLGLTLGATAGALFAALSVAGSVVAYGCGLSFPVDEGMTNEAAPILAHFFTLMGVALLFASNAHIMLLESVLRSFETFPPGEITWRDAWFLSVPHMFSEGFSLGIHIALPILTLLLLAQIGMAAANRALPQLNGFALIFPICILLMLFGLLLSFGGGMMLFVGHFSERLETLWELFGA